MQIIKDKQYEYEKEIKNLKFVSMNSNGTLSFVMDDGTHYNFIEKEMRMIMLFIREKLK
jgi:hypothetical protein